MIPSLVLAGLVFGRWWRTTLLAAAVAWPAWLVAGGVMHLETDLLGAAALAVANTAVGVAAHQGALGIVRRLRAGRGGTDRGVPGGRKR